MRFSSSLFAGVAALFSVGVIAFDTSCSTLEPHPIGIDFGVNTVTVSFAHDVHNCTVLATAESVTYSRHMARLRSEHNQLMGVGKLFERHLERPPISTMLFLISKYFLLKLRARLTFLDHPAIQDSEMLRYMGQIYRNSTRYLQTIVQIGKGYIPLKSSDDITLEDIYDTFVDALKSVQASSRKHHNEDIPFALLSVPDFFNQTISTILLKAAASVGIQSIENPIPAALAIALGAGVVGDTRALIFEQSKSHVTLYPYQERGSRLKKTIRQRPLPIDPYSSPVIDRMTISQLLRRSSLLRNQVELGADKAHLTAEVAKARLLIKGTPDIDSSALQPGDAQSEDSGHHEQWPLQLKDWWLGKEEEVFLLWQDVEAVETTYVQNLSKLISDFLKGLRYARTNDDSGIKEEIDTVIIATSCDDGRLLKRAVIDALGNELPIIGGSLGSGTLAAEGMAITALRRRKNWEILQERSKKGHLEL